MAFDDQRRAIQNFIDGHAAHGDIQPSAWTRRGDTVSLTQRCICGARQETIVDGDMRVELADGRILPVADQATELADIVRLHAAA